jgi:hypothetical protein
MENTLFLKERDMFTKILLRTVLLVLMILLTSSAMYAKEATSEPIIEGKGVAGLKIGDTEESVISVISRGLFKLYKVERGLDLNDKFISFGNVGEDGGLVIDVLLSKGKVVAILLISEPVKGNHIYKGKTKEGFSFGDTFQKMEQLYGKPVIEKGIYMYKKEGIAFGTVGPIEGKEPNSIIIMSPGSDFNIDAIFQ